MNEPLFKIGDHVMVRYDYLVTNASKESREVWTNEELVVTGVERGTILINFCNKNASKVQRSLESTYFTDSCFELILDRSVLEAINTDDQRSNSEVNTHEQNPH